VCAPAAIANEIARPHKARVRKCLLAGLILGLSSPAAAFAPRPPVKGWVVDYADTDCTASRDYGNGAGFVELAFRPSPLGHALQLILVRPGRGEAAMHVPITIGLPDGPLKTTALRYWDHKGHEIILLTAQSETMERLRGASDVSFRSANLVDEDLAVPGMAKAMAALDICNSDLRRHWNAGEEGAGKVKTPARSVAPLASYVSDGDYPAQAVDENRGGISKVTLLIDETGTLKDCLVEETSGIATLDAMTCAIFIRRAKFHPALDDQGKPVKSILSTRIKWVMP
jgi:hypothetical protein